MLLSTVYLGLCFVLFVFIFCFVYFLFLLGRCLFIVVVLLL